MSLLQCLCHIHDENVHGYIATAGLDIIGVRIFFIFCLYTPTSVEVSGVSNVAGVVQQQLGHPNPYYWPSIPMLHLSNQDIVGSRDVAIILPTTLKSSIRSEVGKITLYAVSKLLLLSLVRLSNLRIFLQVIVTVGDRLILGQSGTQFPSHLISRDT